MYCKYQNIKETRCLIFSFSLRPVAGEEAGRARVPPPQKKIFRFELSGIFLTKMDSCQWKLQFPSIVDHSTKIMYWFSSVQFGIV